MTAPTVLALDLATQSGWAIGPVGGRPRGGSIDFGRKDETPGEAGARFTRWLSDLLKVERPRLIVCEKPLKVQVLAKLNTPYQTIERLYGLVFLARSVAQMRGVWDFRLAEVQDVRQHFTGQRTFKDATDPLTGKKISSRKMAKSAVINACRMRGWDVSDDDHADAMATWSYGCALVDPRYSVLATPLFRRPA